jgi:hypothetical protein
MENTTKRMTDEEYLAESVKITAKNRKTENRLCALATGTAIALGALGTGSCYTSCGNQYAQEPAAKEIRLSREALIRMGLAESNLNNVWIEQLPQELREQGKDLKVRAESLKKSLESYREKAVNDPANQNYLTRDEQSGIQMGVGLGGVIGGGLMATFGNICAWALSESIGRRRYRKLEREYFGEKVK